LQFDVFAHYQKKLKPQFATFFTNSTAHLQHAYWRNMEPQKFDAQPTESDQRLYSDAILFGYEMMDSLLGRFVDMVSEDTMLIFTTALSQQPFLKDENVGGQKFYRLKNVNGFLKALGISFIDVQPVMTHQFKVRFENTDQLNTACAILEQVTCHGQPVFNCNQAENNSLNIGCPFHHTIDADSHLQFGRKNESLKFFDAFYLIDATKSGYHHPDGALWIQYGGSHKHQDKVSVLDVFPTVLDFFNVTTPQLENNVYRGTSLLPTLVSTEHGKAA